MAVTAPLGTVDPPDLGFGATARHPAQGLLRAQDMSFAFEVIDLTEA